MHPVCLAQVAGVVWFVMVEPPGLAHFHVLELATYGQLALFVGGQRYMESRVVARIVALVDVLIERVAGGQADNQDSAQLAPFDRVQQRLHDAHERRQDFRQERIVDRAQVLEVFFDREAERPAQVDAVGGVVRAAQEVLAHRDLAPPVRVGFDLCQ